MIGGDVIIHEVKMKAANRHSSIILYHQDKQSKQLSFFSIYMLLCKAGIATDPFLVGEVFLSGTWTTLLYGILLVLITQLSFYLFVKSWIYGRAYSYDQVWKEVFGPTFSWVVMLLVIITYLSFVIWYQYELYYYVVYFCEGLWENVPSILTNQYFVSYVLTFVFIVPTLFVKKLSGFTVISIISNFCHIVAFLCLIIYFFRYDHMDPVSSFPISNDPATNFNSIGVLHAALFFHPVLAELVKDLENPTENRIMKLTWATTITSFVMHFFGGFFAYLVEPNNDGDVIFYYLDPHAPEVIIGQVATYIISIFSNIFYSHYLSRRIAELILPNSSEDIISCFMSGVTSILLAISLNFLSEIVTTVFDLIASIATILLVFLLPSVFYLQQYRFSNKMWGILSIILIIVGVPIGVLTVVYGSLDM